MRYPLDTIFVTQPYGANGGRHKGVDFRAPRPTPLLATSDGWIKKKGYDARGWGNYVVMDHGWYVDLFAHMAWQSKLLINERFNEGDLIGNADNTGLSTGDHLHYEVFDGVMAWPLRRRTDPMAFIKKHMAATQYEGRTIVSPKGEWYWIVEGKKCLIPDYLTGAAYGLLKQDAVKVGQLDINGMSNGEQLRYWDGKYYRLIEDMRKHKDQL